MVSGTAMVVSGTAMVCWSLLLEGDTTHTPTYAWTHWGHGRVWRRKLGEARIVIKPHPYPAPTHLDNKKHYEFGWEAWETGVWGRNGVRFCPFSARCP